MTLERLWKRILYREPYTLWDIPAFFLWVASLLYRVGAALHQRLSGPPTAVGKPVISVGNLSVGGAGKTPLVGMLAARLLDAGLRVGVVSSGYGRQSDEPVLEPGYRVQRMDTGRVGDEVRLLAERLPEAVFAVDASKTAAARRLADRDDVDVIIVDDGFQHRRLRRDLDIVAYDAAVKRRVLKLFPYGILREPLSALKRADIIVVTRARFATDIKELLKRLARINPLASLYTAQFVPEALVGRDRSLPVKYLEDKSVFLFAGVGNFLSLRRQVAALAGDLDGWLELSDHQVYDTALLEHIKRLADRYDSDVIVTTAKDWVKLGDFDFGREIYYLDISVDLDPGEEKLTAQVLQRLNLTPQRR